VTLEARYADAARRTRYSRRQRELYPDRVRATQRGHARRHRDALIEFLGGECERCGLRDRRGLVIGQPPGALQSWNQLYTLMLHEPEEARATLRVLCATCRQIERAAGAHQSPVVQPPASPSDQPSDASPSDQPDSSRFRRPADGGDDLAGAELDADGVSFGSDF
jgi:hypothetical protein